MIKAIYNGKKSIELVNAPVPKANDNDIVIKNIYSSICGTDIAVFNNGNNTGHKIELGQEFGHETISEVVEVGKNVNSINIGDIVYPYPLFAKDDTKRAGTIGIAAAISLKHFGIKKVMIVDLSDFRLQKCKQLGFEICNSEKCDLKESMIEYFGEANSLHGKTADVDIFIEAQELTVF